MFKRFLKLGGKESGFTLTEVLIGIMILTIAIVAASNLLVSLINTNRNNVKTLQAFYLAQEGVEAVRNIRDTNWLHNLDFDSEDGVYSDGLEPGRTYSVFLTEAGWHDSLRESDLDKTALKSRVPWNFTDEGPVGALEELHDNFALGVEEDNFRHFYTKGDSDDAIFFRHIDIESACDNSKVLRDKFLEDGCEDFVLIRSVVNWKDGGEIQEVALDAVLSNWKGGAL